MWRHISVRVWIPLCTWACLCTRGWEAEVPETSVTSTLHAAPPFLAARALLLWCPGRSRGLDPVTPKHPVCHRGWGRGGGAGRGRDQNIIKEHLRGFHRAHAPACVSFPLTAAPPPPPGPRKAELGVACREGASRLGLESLKEGVQLPLQARKQVGPGERQDPSASSAPPSLTPGPVTGPPQLPRPGWR